MASEHEIGARLSGEQARLVWELARCVKHVVATHIRAWRGAAMDVLRGWLDDTTHHNPGCTHVLM
jgi:hypothetical protein